MSLEFFFYFFIFNLNFFYKFDILIFLKYFFPYVLFLHLDDEAFTFV